MRWLIVLRLTLLLFVMLQTLSGVASGYEPEPDCLRHQWRGPQANGTSATAYPPVTWNEDTNIKWKVAIDGRGTSTTDRLGQQPL